MDDECFVVVDLGEVYSIVLLLCIYFFFFFKQKTAYEMRISDWSSDVCSSDLAIIAAHADGGRVLVLPTSFATLAALVERTEKVLGSHLLDHRPGMKLNQLFASFNTDHDAVLVSPAAWEGFDSRVRHLIIPR